MNYTECVKHVFAPLTDLARKPELLDKLKTVDVADERKERQFERYKTFKISNSDIVYLPNSGFACLFTDSFGTYLAVSTPTLNGSGDDSLDTWAASLDLSSDEFDESLFLRFAYHLRGFFRLSKDMRNPEDALEFIDVIDDAYAGHEFSELISLYRPVQVFRIPADSLYIDSGIYPIAANLVNSVPEFRSYVINEKLNYVLSKIEELDSISSESVFSALTSAQWRHVFLELYRMLEGILYLPGILGLKHSLGIATNAVDLKNQVRATLRWREKEKESIYELFQFVKMSVQANELEDTIELFKSQKNSKDFQRGQIGRVIYDVRNSLVHFEDHEGKFVTPESDSEWSSICLYLALIVLSLYQHNSRELQKTIA